MTESHIALLHPGEMGAAVGRCLAGRGLPVSWVFDGRSAATRARAAAAGLEECLTLEQALDGAGIVLSICPPHGAMELARAVAGRKGFRGLYVDANAIAPSTARDIARLIETAGGHFVDGGIIGPPPTSPGRTRFYVCGRAAPEVAGLFAATDLETIVLDGEVGAASALKMCFAAWNKGATALLAGIRALAQAEGVDSGLLAEWRLSRPELPAQSEVVTTQARKAWRWVAEMDEIAATFEAAGLPGGFHHAAAEIFERLSGFKDGASNPSLDEVTAALLRR